MYTSQPGYGFEPTPRRSSIPKVVGILMIVLCSLGLVGGLIGMAMGQDKNFGHLPEWQKLHDMSRMFGLIQLPISIFGLVTGILAVRYRAVAPKLALGYAGAAALHTVVNAAVMYPITQKAMDAAMGHMGGSHMSGAVNAGMGIGLVFGLIFGLAWPIVVGTLMSRPGAKTACAH